METVWRSSRSADGASHDIMTHVLDPIQFYSYPPGFNFEGDKTSWITPQNVEDFRAALAGLPGPVLAYCRSGTRCRNLWMLVQA